MSINLNFSTDSTITPEALERKKRFLAAKKLTAEPVYRLWFTDTGDIAAFTKNPDFVPNDSWHTHDFDQSVLQMLSDPDVNLGNYYVDKKHQIKARTHTDAYAKFGKQLVKCEANSQAAIDLTVSNNILTVTSSPKNTTLVFYITKLNDPHYLLDTATFPPGCLDKKLNIPYNKQKHSIYTKPVYTYNLT